MPSMNHRESMEEDDMVKSKVGNTLIQRRTNEEDKRAANPKGLRLANQSPRFQY